jgi:PAS domain S-box-containing protein
MKQDTTNPVIAPLAAAQDPVPSGQVLNRRDDHFYEELSRINNELANLQRELARANADLVASHKKFEVGEQRYRSLSACSPIGIFELDAAGRCIYTNSYWQDISGLTAEESLGDGWQRALNPDDAPAFLEERDRARQAGQEFIREVRFVNTRGDQRWAQIRSRTIPAEGGEATGRVGTIEDITERKRAQEASRESEEKFHQLADNITDVFWICSPDFKTIHYVSAGYKLIWDRSMESLYANPHQWVEAILPEEREHVFGVFTTLMGDAPEVSVEYRVARPDGTIRWIHDRGFQVRDAAGKLIRLSGIASDITEQKRTAQELAEHKANEESARLALEHEQKSSQIKSRFVSLVSHEFRTPLSVINMAAELLDGYLDKMTEAERSEHLNEIRNSVERMTEMMNDFLIHGNCASKKIECQPAWVEVEALCRRIIAEGRSHGGSPRTIELQVDSAVGEAWLDDKILRHILGNLLSNAVKYSFDGRPVTLEVKRIGGSPQPNGGTDPSSEHRLEFKVSDSGIGIPAADLPKLYQTFHRAANVGNRPGTGMGLAIVKQFVDLLGGTIRFETEEGKGTKVWVELPAAGPVQTAN